MQCALDWTGTKPSASKQTRAQGKWEEVNSARGPAKQMAYMKLELGLIIQHCVCLLFCLVSSLWCYADVIQNLKNAVFHQPFQIADPFCYVIMF